MAFMNTYHVAAANKISTLIYFSFAGATVFICVLGFLVLERLPITQYYMKHQPTPESELESDEEPVSGVRNITVSTLMCPENLRENTADTSGPERTSEGLRLGQSRAQDGTVVGSAEGYSSVPEFSSHV